LDASQKNIEGKPVSAGKGELCSVGDFLFKVHYRKIIQFIIAGALCSQIASASAIYSFITAPGQTITPNGSGAVSISARVDFIVSGGQMIVNVYNTSVNSGSVATTINSIDWSYTPAYSTLPSSIAYAGTVINLNPIAGNGHVEDGYTVAAGGFAQLESTTPRWTTAASAQISGGMHLSTITGGNPNQTIIGAPDVYSGGGPGTGTYNANSAMVTDNPYVQTIDMSHPAQFTLVMSALQASEVVTRARMTWGTALDVSNQVELVSTVPEPGTIFLAGCGAFLILLGARRKIQVS
jgi:hypothetical protein